MKSLVFIYAPSEIHRAFDMQFSQESAFMRTLAWAGSLSSGTDSSVVVACDSEVSASVHSQVDSCREIRKSEISCRVLEKDSWTCAELVDAMAFSCGNEYSNLVFTTGDRPFLDTALSLELIESHSKYLAEYTFADGWPSGFAPEVVNSGTLRILCALVKEKYTEMGSRKADASAIISLIKTDINSFEVETLMAPKDYRMLRLDFSCTSKEKTLACRNLYEEAMERGTEFSPLKLTELAENSVKVQRTVPSYYSIQVCNEFTSIPSYSPVKSRYFGGSRKVVMDIAKFRLLVENIAEYSGEAVVSLSAWGEFLLAPEAEAYVEAVLAHKGLKVLIETDGLCITEDLAKKIRGVQEGLGRMGADDIIWIVNLDAFSKEKYELIHVDSVVQEPFDCAVTSVSLLQKIFGDCVYPQFTRMKCNEDELESFYRFWHEKTSASCGKLIIQKYDSFCGLLSDEKPADLSPLERNVCWHIKRDMTILCNGDVPRCKECLDGESVGNVFVENLEKIWRKSDFFVENQMKMNYCDMCGKCDEYYTFNF